MCIRDRDGEHHGQHHQRKVGQAGRFGREDDEDDILKHDQQAEKAEDQQVQQIMDAANALLLGAVTVSYTHLPITKKWWKTMLLYWILLPIVWPLLHICLLYTSRCV